MATRINNETAKREVFALGGFFYFYPIYSTEFGAVIARMIQIYPNRGCH
jgi:hypothetical protein